MMFIYCSFKSDVSRLFALKTVTVLQSVVSFLVKLTNYL
jgi:hypothetical protein